MSDTPQDNGSVIPLRILYVGALWQGSNARSLCDALHRLGHIVQEVDENHWFSPATRNLSDRLLARALSRRRIWQYNATIQSVAQRFDPEVVLIYKGANVELNTLVRLRRLSRCVANVYPDVSFHSHGPRIPRCIPHYDLVVTTKSFHQEVIPRHFGAVPTQVVLHGFDPLLHRPIGNSLEYDVGFIGTWSRRKELMLEAAFAHLPAKVSLVIHGGYWHRARSSRILRCVKSKGVFGFTYSQALATTRINLALLSGSRVGSGLGDQTTARTFEIPGCGGFMLHQRTDEVRQCFSEGEEMACFGSPEELSQSVSYYLAHEDERRRIAAAGNARARRDHTIEARASEILAHVYKLL